MGHEAFASFNLGIPTAHYTEPVSVFLTVLMTVVGIVEGKLVCIILSEAPFPGHLNLNVFLYSLTDFSSRI